MGYFARLFDKRAHPSNPGDGFLSMLSGGVGTTSGVDVTHDSALGMLAVYACVRVLAEGAASLPLIVYERTQQGKRRAQNVPLYNLLHDAPNPEMTSMEMREALMGHTVLRGNGYAEIEWTNGGQVKAIWPLRPDKTKPIRINRELAYEYTLPNGGTTVLASRLVLHLRGLGPNGLMGYDPISIARQAIGLGLGAEEFGGRFYGNGARPGIILNHPGKLSLEAQTRLKKAWADRHEGLSNAHRVAVLEEGMTAQEVGVAPDNAQFLETRKFQVSEIARMFRVQPHMIGDLDRATFSNIEHQSLEYVIHTLRPWLVRWEQRIQQTLFVGEDRKRYYAEHLVDGLLRGDTKSRYESYSIGRQNGWLSANDIRSLENMNPIDGGDIYLIPLNMAQLSSGKPVGASPAGGRAADRALAVAVEERAVTRRSLADAVAARQALGSSQMPILQDIAGRVVRREVADVTRAVQKFLRKGGDLAGFLLWMEDFYEKHQDFVGRNFGPALESMALLVLAAVAEELDENVDEDRRKTVVAFVDEYATGMGLRWALSSRGQLIQIAEEYAGDTAGAADAMDERAQSWELKQPEKAGRREAWQALGALSRRSYIAYAVQKLIWRTGGTEDCPYCDGLAGKIVGISEPFLSAGNYQPDGADAPLKVRRNTFHPPAHSGCDCVVFSG